MWLVDPWHTCLLVESCVPIHFVPQVLVNLVIGLGSYRLLSNNLIAVCWCIHVCTTSRITRVLVRACWSDIVCQTMWLVDPWHTCLLVESCVPIYFVPQVLVNLVIGLGSYRLFCSVLMHTCLHNFPNHQSTRTSLLIRHSVPNYVARWPLTRLPACGKLRPNLLCATGACQSCHWLRIIQIALQQSNCGVLMHTCLHNFPNHQSTRTSLLIRHSVPNYVARWPLTRLPACGKSCPNLLCATGACQSCHWLRIIQIALQQSNCGVLMHTCLHNFPITRVLVRACWSDIVCQTMWHVDPWHACLLVESRVPIYFVPQVLVNLVIGLGSNHTDWPSTVQWCLVLGFLNVNRFVKTRILSSRKVGCHKKSHSVFHRGGFVDDNFSLRLDVARISLGLRPHCGPAVWEVDGWVYPYDFPIRPCESCIPSCWFQILEGSFASEQWTPNWSKNLSCVGAGSSL